MKTSYDPVLTEQVVQGELRRREASGDLRPVREYHRRAESIYETVRPDHRQAEFEKLHQQVFLDFGFGRTVLSAVAEFRELGKLGELCVGKAGTDGQEWADLSRDRTRAGLKIRPARFFDPEGLLRCLRHEFQHIADMLDETFGYRCPEELAGASPAETNLITNRYGTIWDIYVDGRLQRRGKATPMDREGRLREFEAMYAEVAPSTRALAFEALWTAERLTHAEILEMAGDPRRALERGARSGGALGGAWLPGALCPICRFPTFRWAEGLSQLHDRVLESLKRDFPLWVPEQGACERCLEVYRATVAA